MQKEKIKVLYFVDRLLRGGIQSFILEVVKNIDKSRIQIDVLTLDDGKTYELENELKELGCNIYKLQNVWLNRISSFILYNKRLEEFLKEHNDYDIIHMHSSSKNWLLLKKAKKYGIQTRIAHSHCTEFQTKNKFKKLIGNMMKIMLRKYATDYFACSNLAGYWMFGKNKAINVIHNGIDINKFKFNLEIREKIREDLKLENNLVLGHVGRFSNVKNHEFLIKFFKLLNDKNKNFTLLLLGTGEKETEIKKLVKELKIEESVKFLGFIENVSDYLNAMDVFVLPSLHEGLPIVGIEAQANGLYCLFSSTITKKTKITPNVEFIDIKDPNDWKNEILKNINKFTVERNMNTEKYIVESGYDIKQTANKLKDFYIKKVRNEENA